MFEVPPQSEQVRVASVCSERQINSPQTSAVIFWGFQLKWKQRLIRNHRIYLGFHPNPTLELTP